MPNPRRRRQPARDHLAKQRWSINKAADEIGVPRGHLHNVVFGTCGLSDEVRERLPELLNLPLEELFESDVLTRPYTGHRDGHINHPKRKAGGSK